MDSVDKPLNAVGLPVAPAERHERSGRGQRILRHLADLAPARLPDSGLFAREGAEEEHAARVVRVGDELGHAALRQPARAGLERAPAVVRVEDALALGADIEAARAPVHLEGGHDERLACDARPGRAAVVGAMEPADRRGVHDTRARRVPPSRER